MSFFINMKQREIKFRAWDKEEKEFVKNILIGLKGEIKTVGALSGKFLYDVKDRIILTQFTGLLDKSGKEIYEGDILQCHVYSCPARYVIEWNDSSASFFARVLNEELKTVYATTWKDFINKDEVIGNIYENKELLK